MWNGIPGKLQRVSFCILQFVTDARAFLMFGGLEDDADGSMARQQDIQV